MTKRPDSDAGADVRLRTLRILWAVFLANVGLMALASHFARPEMEAGGVPPLLYALAAAALSSVAASFFLKASYYRRAAERQEPAQLQTGFIVALALCEAPVLLGLVGLFATGCDYAYALFALGALGIALHFPRREQVFASYFKSAM